MTAAGLSAAAVTPLEKRILGGPLPFYALTITALCPTKGAAIGKRSVIYPLAEWFWRASKGRGWVPATEDIIQIVQSARQCTLIVTYAA